MAGSAGVAVDDTGVCVGGGDQVTNRLTMMSGSQTVTCLRDLGQVGPCFQ